MAARSSDVAQPSPTAVVALRAVDRATAELRRGGVAMITNGGGGATLVLAAECATPEGLDRLTRLNGGTRSLVLTAPRAAALKLVSGTGPVVVAPLDEKVDCHALRDLADPSAPLDGALFAALERARGTPQTGDHAAIALAKRASLLPATVTLALTADVSEALAAAGDLVSAEADDVLAYERTAAASLRPVSEARVPLAGAEQTRIITFRPGDGGTEHLAIIIGEPKIGREPKSEDVTGGGPLTRLHSECFTGDLLGSLRCDCGDQLRGAIDAMAAEGSGILLYLAQEGRGIGLVNKLRAYNLQDAGFDTVDANTQLGFDADERLYLPAAEMLGQLGFTTVRLMTNNPDKVVALERSGINVTERVPLVMPASGYSEHYLATKAQRFGHLY
ncbi:MAG: GTP cyclohydrolase II RibA [Pseudomonadota bacterium]|nr:GTP cyclohydrolase II RibA [Pseudomonadota bacterium]